MKDSGKKICCSFCGKLQGEVKRLIAGPGVYICDECIEVCYDLVSEGNEDLDFTPAEVATEDFKLLKPKEIKEKRAKIQEKAEVEN